MKVSKGKYIKHNVQTIAGAASYRIVANNEINSLTIFSEV